MTIDERFERIEHATAEIAEERRRDREEFRQWRREHQRRLDAIDERMDRFVSEAAARDREFDRRMAEQLASMVELDRASREGDDQLGKRIRIAGIGYSSVSCEGGSTVAT